ncbi:hypothetical protein D3C87_1632860 [compost metagenome]
MRRKNSKSHIHDTNSAKKIDSYQTRNAARDMETKSPPTFKREDLGFTKRDTRGYDKMYKGNY